MFWIFSIKITFRKSRQLKWIIFTEFFHFLKVRFLWKICKIKIREINLFDLTSFFGLDISKFSASLCIIGGGSFIFPPKKIFQSCIPPSFPETIPFKTDRTWFSKTLWANFEPFCTANERAVSPLKSDLVKSAPWDKSSLTEWGWFCMAANINGVQSFSSKASTSLPWLINIRMASWWPAISRNFFNTKIKINLM